MTQKLNSTNPIVKGSKEAADAIRDRIRKLNGQHEHDLEHDKKHQSSLIAKFWSEHHSHPDKNLAWREFYEKLNDDEKHQVWRETNQNQADQQTSQIQTGSIEEEVAAKPKTVAETKKQLLERTKQAGQSVSGFKGTYFKPFLTALIVVFSVLLLNYNDLVVAQVRQYITPGSGQNSPVIIDPNSNIEISDEPRIIIPKINVDVPVVYDEPSFEEAAVQAALERGVVHYGSTAFPGQAGNNVIVGHSSNNFFNSGKYKFAFVLLDRLEIDDTFILHYEGQRYIYRIYNKVVISPDDFSVIQPTTTPTTTLITCTPPGTAWRRLVVQAEQISPSPSQAQQKAPKSIQAPQEGIVPGNSQSLFDRFTDLIF